MCITHPWYLYTCVYVVTLKNNIQYCILISFNTMSMMRETMCYYGSWLVNPLVPRYGYSCSQIERSCLSNGAEELVVRYLAFFKFVCLTYKNEQPRVNIPTFAIYIYIYIYIYTRKPAHNIRLVSQIFCFFPYLFSKCLVTGPCKVP